MLIHEGIRHLQRALRQYRPGPCGPMEHHGGSAFLIHGRGFEPRDGSCGLAIVKLLGDVIGTVGYDDVFLLLVWKRREEKREEGFIEYQLTQNDSYSGS